MSEEIKSQDVLKLSETELRDLVQRTEKAEGVSESHQQTRIDPAEDNILFRGLNKLKPFYPGQTQLDSNDMRISFLGTSVVQRRMQVCCSVFVELGNGDSFVFDCGAGATVNYAAMKIPMSKIRKIFLTHLHGDHTSDLTHIYGFGPQQDGKSPLYIWGPSASGVEDPQIPGKYYDDGTLSFCRHLREMNRWHTEAQSFVPTQWADAEGDGYDIFATELNWINGDSSEFWTTNSAIPKPHSDKWIAYEKNGVKISFFPAVHDRNGSISYKLEWNGLSMIFTGDTKPNRFLIDHATNGVKGVDVLISEMVVPPEVWSTKNGGTDEPGSIGMVTAEAIQENSHTQQKAFGYILNETYKQGKAPRLAVATHFQAEDDTIFPALRDIRSWYPQENGDVMIATDLMVINVSREKVDVLAAEVSDFSWIPPLAPRQNYDTKMPKYKDLKPSNPYAPMAPLAQLDQSLLDQVIDSSLYDTNP
jgi:ribonuclease Z